jgi:hypothetical protein
LEAVCATVIAKFVTLIAQESNAEAQEMQVKAFGHWLAKSDKLAPEATKVYSTVLADGKKQEKTKCFLESLNSAATISEGISFVEKFKQVPEDLSKALFQIFDKVKQRTTLRAEGLLVASFFSKISVEVGDSQLASQIAKAGVWDYLFSDQSFFLNNPKEFVARLDAEIFPVLIRFIEFVCQTEFFDKYWQNNSGFLSLMMETTVQGNWSSRRQALNVVTKAHEKNKELSEKLLSTFYALLAQVYVM